MAVPRSESGMPPAVVLSLLLQVLSLGWSVQQFFSASGIVVTGPVVFGLVLPALLLAAMARRQNWARIVWLLLYVIAGAAEPIVTGALSRHRVALVDQAFGGADVIPIVLDLLALALVFLPSASRWFHGSGGPRGARDATTVS